MVETNQTNQTNNKRKISLLVDLKKKEYTPNEHKPDTHFDENNNNNNKKKKKKKKRGQFVHLRHQRRHQVKKKKKQTNSITHIQVRIQE